VSGVDDRPEDRAQRPFTVADGSPSEQPAEPEPAAAPTNTPAPAFGIPTPESALPEPPRHTTGWTTPPPVEADGGDDGLEWPSLPTEPQYPFPYAPPGHDAPPSESRPVRHSRTPVARLTRGQMLSLKETEFVEAAKAIGVSDRSIVTRHLLPNGMGPIIVAITLGIPTAILAEATLAFIGVGVQPPRASWGSLIADGQKYVRGDPHLVVFPAICIALALIGFTFLGDGLRDALDPKLKGKQ